MPPTPWQKVEVTDEALNLVTKFEAVHTQAYFDCSGYPTFGIGHLIKQSEYKQYFGDKMNISGARDLYNKDREKFYSLVPKFSLEYVYDLKRKDMAIATKAVENKYAVCKITSAPARLGEILADLAFNAGPGSLDGDVTTLLRKKDFDGIALFIPHYCLARDPHKPIVNGKAPSVPFTGLTFRRYSFVWYYFTGEVWRIGGERGRDEDWKEADQFLHKLTDLLKTRGRSNPLPYANNRREAQKY